MPKKLERGDRVVIMKNEIYPGQEPFNGYFMNYTGYLESHIVICHTKDMNTATENTSIHKTVNIKVPR